MLGSLVNYLFGGNFSGTQDSLEGDPLTSRSIMRRFRQMEVEGDDWILINRAAEGTSALEESWYVTPPACFTQVGPVIVETSPMENLLIEHPSMSVYRATTSHVTPDTPPPTPDTAEELEEPVGFFLLPFALMSSTSTLSTSSTSLDSSPDRDRNPDLNDLNEFAHRTAIHDDRPLTSEWNDENRVRITNQLRSAQKVLQKRSTQKLKKGRLERSNKVRQITGKRLRRQDRLRIQNSGANNNRKC
ncbi:PREDICTED: tumor protein p53-inducible nuclear protein 2 [Dinoponera quadriceps]|uniref:Tumor protein p53-inducible nuclear protein 2 n=1 Tax=Dinoponera quadriceps TaxID=609295 RepID=A0A6P3XZN7_DINQU|nr:PREDICTED: tumor protein p53-inducible nuclear protein 2 [Dinoponera quadriceps]XP_014483990.1 PREDICTED: tumor protein p53-inducible nuclear protein 2 [Dinoponera quadriceps]XP_014483991.1 PREDICTED: tumor protein p53-inducible nuclear protein 2 [Dinoponera quadriceps]XP_014483992.1 PREDICTED: tumor protein p53-inducible nuclear protein 2 [Dinoponera quadriceps]